MLDFNAPEVQIVTVALIVLSFSALSLALIGTACRAIIGAYGGKAAAETARQ